MDEEFEDLFKIRRNRKELKAGNVLIAEPFLDGACFSRSVVYITEHNQQGSVGFVLNKPVSHVVSELVSELEGMDCPVFMGGPVGTDRLYYLHTHGEVADALAVRDGVYWGGDFGQVCRLLKSGRMAGEEIRFFAGYSGWDSGQLEAELKENSWMIGDITGEEIFETVSEDDLWRLSMSSLGGKHRIWADFPEHPMLN